MQTPQFGGDLPLTQLGVRSPFGILLPPGGRVAAYVGNGAYAYDEQPGVRNNRVTTLAAGLARARSGYGDTVIVLPGHSESVSLTTGMANLKAGTQVVGVGRGSLKPTFQWTATTANWAVAVADVVFSGLKLKFDGANGITSAITVTAAGVSFEDNEIVFASGAALKAAIGFTIGTGAHDFSFDRNYGYGSATHNVTDGILVSAAVDRFKARANYLHASATAANGLLRFSAAATKICVCDNIILNDHTSSVAAMALGSAAVTGVVARNLLGHNAVATITSGTNGVSFSGSVDVRFFENRVCDAAANGIAMPAAAT